MRLLLDSHIAQVVARQLQRATVDAVSLNDWQGSRHRRASDEQVLEAAAAEERVLVTYDCRTIPVLLKDWAEMRRSHGGVVLVDEQTVDPADVGGLLRALQALASEGAEWDWRDRVVFLKSR